jgi:hypothetical protein
MRGVVAVALAGLAVAPVSAGADPWSARRIARLPDTAFAAVEAAPDGRLLRHLPHHDGTGAVDLAHLRAAISRLGAVHWQDAASAPRARCHLERHAREAGLGWRSGLRCDE